jgi:hypothetical protein
MFFLFKTLKVYQTYNGKNDDSRLTLSSLTPLSLRLSIYNTLFIPMLTKNVLTNCCWDANPLNLIDSLLACTLASPPGNTFLVR